MAALRAQAGLAPADPLALALSGGADSLALAVLASEAWAPATRPLALIVDHALRAGSRDEALAAADAAERLGLRARILTRTAPKGPGSPQGAARRLRYELLAAACAALGIAALLLAHHADDQAETVLLRLARGSGVDGLAGMAPVTVRGEVTLLRPLLDVPRAALRALPARHGLTPALDPTNRDLRHARPRLRHAGAALAREGLTVARLTDLAARAREVVDLLDRQTRSLAEAALVWSRDLVVACDPAPLAKAEPELVRRLLSALVRTLAGREHPPRRPLVERLRRHLGAGDGAPRAITAGGCLFRRRDGGWLVGRELAACAPARPLPAGARVLWDGRFVLEVAPEAPDGLSCGALGAVTRPAAARDLPASLAAALPALRDGAGTIVALPTRDWWPGLASTMVSLRPLPAGGWRGLALPGGPPYSPVARVGVGRPRVTDRRADVEE